MKTHHILNSASNLLGAALVIMTALHITGYAKQTYADEIAFASAILLLASCMTSYQAIRRDDDARIERVADWLFLSAQILLVVSVLSFWF